MVAVEGSQGADGLVEGRAGELAVGLEVDKEVENLGRFEIRQRGAGEVIGKLGGPAEIGLDGAVAQAVDIGRNGGGPDTNGANLREIWDGFCALKFSSRALVLSVDDSSWVCVSSRVVPPFPGGMERGHWR